VITGTRSGDGSAPMEMPADTPNYPPEASSAAKGVVTSLLLAVKMFSLYADDHAHCRSALTRIHEHIESFLRDYGELVFQVEKSRLVFDHKGVYQGSEKEGDIAFGLFRDGILDLRFQKGIESEETRTFLRILDRYKTLPAEAEGDIVTALWEAELPHIRYQAADNILETEAEAEAKSLEKRSGEAKGAWGGSVPLEMHMIAENIMERAQGVKELPSIDLAAVQLTAEEARKLEEMVSEEEERDGTREILDMMADILRSQEDESFFGVVLDFLEEELSAALYSGEFEISFRIMKRVHQIRQLCEDYRPWALSLVDEFMGRISTADFLEPLGESLAIINESQLKMAGKTLYMFPSSAIGILAPMLPKAPSSVVRAVLSKVVEGLAARDFRPLEKILENGNEDLLCRLVPLLGHMKDNKSAQALLNMARHPSARVRRLGLKTVISRGLWAPERLMSLIDDESDGIRQLFLKYLGAHRSEAAETQLLIYLRDRKARRGDQKHLVACFRALGRCGVGKSLPFLQDTLLSGRWFSKFFSSPRREGAAAALAELGTEESEEVLEAACDSRYPGIRRAAQFAVSDGSVSEDMP